MPYFVYRVSPDRKLKLIETFSKFQEARTLARSIRAQQNPEDNHIIRMIFAEDAKKAQLLLTDLRNPKTEGDD